MERNFLALSHVRAGGCGLMSLFTQGQGRTHCNLNCKQETKCHMVPGNTVMTWQHDAETHGRVGETNEKSLSSAVKENVCLVVKQI